jgi:hypothetical protein
MGQLDYSRKKWVGKVDPGKASVTALMMLHLEVDSLENPVRGYWYQFGRVSSIWPSTVADPTRVVARLVYYRLAECTIAV